MQGRVALVTGGSRGIGAAIVRRLATEGAAVAAVARTAEPDPRFTGSLTETIEAVVAAGGKAIAVAGDMSSTADRERVVAQTFERLGPIDVLVNNAAVTFLAPIQELTEKRFRLMMELQVWAPYHLTQLVLPRMYERGSGWVLNISSRAAKHPEGPPFEEIQARGFSGYGMCKAALERFTTALAAEGYPHGVRANALAPFDNVATPGAGAHDLVADFPLEDESVMAEAALALVERDLTGRLVLSQDLLVELGRTPMPAS